MCSCMMETLRNLAFKGKFNKKFSFIQLCFYSDSSWIIALCTWDNMDHLHIFVSVKKLHVSMDVANQSRRVLTWFKASLKNNIMK